MLKYQISRQTFGDDLKVLQYNTISFDDYTSDEDKGKIIVDLGCEDVSYVSVGDMLMIAGTFTYYNSDSREWERIGDVTKIPVNSVNYIDKTVNFIDNKYMLLPITSISADVEFDTDTSTYSIMWNIEFEKAHLFATGENIELYIEYGPGKTVHLNSGLTNVNHYRIDWAYDPSVENAEELSQILFGTIDTTKANTVENTYNLVKLYRNQLRWDNGASAYEGATITLKKYNVSINVPISLKARTDLYWEGNVKEYFVDNEMDKSINASIEMEKMVYTPVVVKAYDSQSGSMDFQDCVKINFNLHFRSHDGDDWTVDNSDSWNFEKYGGSDWVGNSKYYSYTQIPTESKENRWKRSCQSDLLEYLGFVTNDVKYQKNKLKKSFLRLFYYDSDNPATQNLLGYSTVFVDCNKLYSKFISKSNFECYYDTDGNLVKGIKTDREVSTNDLTRILGRSGLTTEEIEDYRLSSQLSVRNKYLSDNSSEGFYLYKWEGEDEADVPNDVYLRIDFNHAGYGRNVPMMAPYLDGDTKAFKDNYDIIKDWSDQSTQYGIKKYTRYSHIHLKTKYDTNTKRRIYYLDPDTYGIAMDGNIMNINLYEARISFND